MSGASDRQCLKPATSNPNARDKPVPILVKHHEIGV